eukprot:TRINITY_DN2243_c0_g1_i2.p1 TRINITY_DN2243_c0_g1~~TRINITY_DN2243_c0_g1_i2.p1  ORF type:complete len:106 (-),score=25.66 TRINITY_DN2243_c0_g1_i2:285-602(-)
MTDITKFTTLGGSEDPNLSEILETLKEQDANPENNNNDLTTLTKGGKRNQKDAGLDSGKIYVPTQNPKANISRQQSSLNTPTCSEQLTDNLISADNIAGGVVNPL